MTPDWIPNIHPFVVHFPVALLVTAVVADLLWQLLRKHSWLGKTTLLLYAAGTAGLMAAYITGQQAVDTVSITGDATPVVNSHEEWALYTTIFFMIFTVLRAIGFWRNWETARVSRGAVVVLALAGAGMLWYTGELGAKLVYKHGTAVSEVERLQERIESMERDLAALRMEASPTLLEDGSWNWRIAPGADAVVHEQFKIEGSRDFETVLGRENELHHLEIEPAGGQTFLLFGEPIRSLEGRIEFRAENFNGEIMLIHHFHDPENYQYLKLSNSGVIQGRLENNSDQLLQSEEIDTESWITLRVTADGRHFYGYTGRQTVTHTHADEMEPGLTGFSFSGNGTFQIRRVEFRSLF